jgi:hypothetical protein
MYDIWLSYIATRMQLYLDLESLRMDERGVWAEGPITTTDYMQASGVSCLAGFKAPASDLPENGPRDSESPNPKPPDQ